MHSEVTMQVLFDDVSFHHRDGRPIVSNARLALGPGWTGLVGPNGAGKSTLLALIGGALHPRRGRVLFEPPDARVGLVPQELGAPRPLEAAFMDAGDKAARRLRATLDVDRLSLARWSTLSPGERRRVVLGAALWDAPDVLLCDEPDAHLDAEARDRVVDALGRHRGVGVIVSHSRGVLDALAEHILWLEQGTLSGYAGSYARARTTRDAEARSAQTLHDDRKRKLAAIASEHVAVTRRHEASDRERNAARRIKGPRDSDARCDGRKIRAASATASLGRREAAIASRLERARVELERVRPEKRLGADVRFARAASPKDRLAVVTFDALGPAPGAPPVLLRTSLVVDRTTRVRLAGPNGAGKSTLLAAIAAAAAGTHPLHLGQEIDVETRVSLLDALRRAPHDEQGRWLACVAALGTAPAQILASACPSPGEAKKLLLARALSRATPLLLLDEPTNDLDLPSIERLEVALAAYDGAIVLVTHDDALAAGTTRDTWRIDPSSRTIGVARSPTSSHGGRPRTADPVRDSEA